MSATLSGVLVRERELELLWSDHRTATVLPLLWLKDNCPGPESQHPDTRQRLVDTFRIPAGLSATGATVEDGGPTLRVEWSGDGHISL